MTVISLIPSCYVITKATTFLIMLVSLIFLTYTVGQRASANQVFSSPQRVLNKATSAANPQSIYNIKVDPLPSLLLACWINFMYYSIGLYSLLTTLNIAQTTDQVFK